MFFENYDYWRSILALSTERKSLFFKYNKNQASIKILCKHIQFHSITLKCIILYTLKLKHKIKDNNHKWWHTWWPASERFEQIKEYRIHFLPCMSVNQEWPAVWQLDRLLCMTYSQIKGLSLELYYSINHQFVHELYFTFLTVIPHLRINHLICNKCLSNNLEGRGWVCS